MTGILIRWGHSHIGIPRTEHSNRANYESLLHSRQHIRNFTYIILLTLNPVTWVIIKHVVQIKNQTEGTTGPKWCKRDRIIEWTFPRTLDIALVSSQSTFIQHWIPSFNGEYLHWARNCSDPIGAKVSKMKLHHTVTFWKQQVVRKTQVCYYCGFRQKCYRLESIGRWEENKSYKRGKLWIMEN